MNTAGIIAEYNPFHNGHAYQIRETRRLTGCKRIIVVMSGNFVQRGAPAIIDKHSRTKMALENGADLVLELPVPYAVASAERFAAAGVEILDRLGIVNTLSFGSEDTDTGLMLRTAGLLLHEDAAFSAKLQDNLKKGRTFAQARAAALPEESAALLENPNATLGTEYCKAILARKSTIKPFPILRKGNGYHEEALSENTYASASAIRKALSMVCNEKKSEKLLSENLPEETNRLLLNEAAKNGLIFENDFSQLLHYRLLTTPDEEILKCPDMSQELLNRIRKLQYEFTTTSEFTAQLKTRNVTYTRISRCLMQILLDIHAYEPINAVRILGFRRKSSDLLSEISRHGSLPLSTAPITDHSDRIYDLIRCHKTHSSMTPETSKAMIIL